MKKRYLIPLVLAAALKFGGCQELPGDQNLRSTLADVCIEHGCCPLEMNAKITPEVERFTTEMRATRIARGSGWYWGFMGAHRRNLQEDRDRIRERIVQDFKDMHE